MQASEILANCFLPFYTRTASAVLIKVSTIFASTLLLALPSGIIIHIVQFSRCAFQPLLRSDFSIQSYLGTEIQAHLVVGQSGLEPPTSRLSVVCSSQLSYWPIATPRLFVTRPNPSDFANCPPALSCLWPVCSAPVLVRCSRRLGRTVVWWRLPDSNR